MNLIAPVIDRPTRLAQVPCEDRPVAVYAPRPLDVELDSPWVLYRTEHSTVAVSIPGLNRRVWPELYTGEDA